MPYDFGVYVLNTGRVGGGEDVPGSKKVRIPDSSAIVKGIAEGTITWEPDPDFGYLVASEVPGVDDPDLLQPRRLYESQGRGDEYAHLVAELREQRRAFLASQHGLAPEIVEAVG